MTASCGVVSGMAIFRQISCEVESRPNMPKPKNTPDEPLKGWAAIAKFLGQPIPTVQRWGNEGMPLTRIGRYVAASPAELERWLTSGGWRETDRSYPIWER